MLANLTTIPSHRLFTVYLLRFSDVLCVIFLELFDDLFVVFLDPSDIAAHAEYCLLYVIVGVEDAVLVAEAVGIAMIDQRGLEFTEDLSVLSLLADKNLLVVGGGITEMLRLIAILCSLLKVFSLHLFEGL